LERVSNLPQNCPDVCRWKWSLREVFGQRLSFNKLEHNSEASLVLHEFVDAGDIRVIERRQNSCLMPQACHTGAVARERLRKNLERNFAVQPQIARPIDLSHAT
jgi:hypothetical protein